MKCIKEVNHVEYAPTSIIPSDTAPGTLYVMDSNGSNQTNLTNEGISVSSPSWSPDGSRIVYERYADLYIINSDGSGLKHLYGEIHDYCGEPSWGPN